MEVIGGQQEQPLDGVVAPQQARVVDKPLGLADALLSINSRWHENGSVL
jgi:hypothetical protein